MSDSDKARKKREQNRRYRENNPDKAREQARQWREANREHRATYQVAWRDRNRDHVREMNRDYMRRKTAEAKTEVERKARKAEYVRNRYHTDVEASRAKAREYRQAARARDPEGYRASRKRANDSWRAKHKDEINARLRERNRIDPDAKRARGRRHYEKHAEERRAYRRRYYEENRERELAKQRQWRQREKRRVDAGLPVRRLHRLTPDERRDNARSADEFFALPVTPELRARLEAELRTPPELIAAWERETARIRATQWALRHPEASARVVNRNEAEEERMDTIARAINDRLRTTPRTARDSDYAFLARSPTQGGLSL